jgi:hypothetical protein
MKRWGPFICLCMICSAETLAQRSYTGNSVLATGNWYRIAVKQEGVYKVDMALLTTLGITTTNLASATIKLYGNGGGVLDENNAIQRTDDLFENPIDISDGGDGLFNGSDYFLFYAPGPHRWLKDSANQSFKHQKNRYSDTSYYYITIGGTGKRIPLQSLPGTATVTVNSYNERYFYENDLVNFLNSGKEWYGEEFNTNLGGNSTRSFTIDWPGLITGQPVTLVTSFAARSVGAASSFSARINGKQRANGQYSRRNRLLPGCFCTAATQRNNVSVAQSSLGLAFTYSPTASGAQGWLNWFELFGRRNLSVLQIRLFFSGIGSLWQQMRQLILRSQIMAALTVWDVTDPLQPVKMNASNNASQTNFSNDASRLREYVAFALTAPFHPLRWVRLPTRTCTILLRPTCLIITHSSLLSEAQRLAQFHSQHDAYKTVTVTVDQVYQEFSGGSPDPSACVIL